MVGRKKQIKLSDISKKFDDKDSHIFLCFFADGPKWDNIQQIPAYPTGYSYFRPFRYRNKWIDKLLLGILNNREQFKTLIGKEVILCMRFGKGSYKNYIIPIRKVIITGLDILADNYSIFFKMGSFFNFLSYDNLADAAIKIPNKGDKTDNDYLFFVSKITGFSNTNNSINENEIWSRLTDLISKDKKLPINASGKNSVFLRFNTPTIKKQAKISTIHSYHNNHNIHGSLLSEGNSYDLKIYHRIPRLFNTNYSFELNYSYESPSKNIEYDRTLEEYSGNYQTHFIEISPRRPSGTWEEILIEPKSKEIKISDKDNITLYAEILRIPIKIKKNYFHRTKSYYAWIFLFSTLLFINSIINHFYDFEENIFAPIISIALSAIIGVIVFLLPKRLWD